MNDDIWRFSNRLHWNNISLPTPHQRVNSNLPSLWSFYHKCCRCCFVVIRNNMISNYNLEESFQQNRAYCLSYNLISTAELFSLLIEAYLFVASNTWMELTIRNSIRKCNSVKLTCCDIGLANYFILSL